MKDVLVRAGSSLFAMVIGYIGLSVFAEGLGVYLKLIVAVGMGTCAFGVAVWAARRGAKNAPRTAHVASNLTGESAHIEDVRAESVAGQDVKVASDIHTQGRIEIKRASVDSIRNKK